MIEGLHFGDAKELISRIDDCSIDMIFTDPVYDRREDYVWLAETAKRVLKPSKPILFWSNGKWHKTNVDWMEECGLVYRWDFACVHNSGLSPMNGKIITKTNRVVWMDCDGSSKIIDYLPDGYLSVPWLMPTYHKEHAWTKTPKFTKMVINAFSKPGDIVLDPFCGGGTIPAMCKASGRRFVAYEIDEDAYRIAIKRIDATTPPIPKFESMMQEMFPIVDI